MHARYKGKNIMSSFEELKENLGKIEQILGYVFKNKDYLLQSFIHSSFVNEFRKILIEHNERLEFLGDAVFQLIISKYLFCKLPESSEGKLSFLRSSIVSAPFCARMMEKWNLEPYLLLGKGEMIVFERGKESILANTFEAILGAIFLDSDYKNTEEFFLRHFETVILEAIEKPERNYKAELQHYAQKHHQMQPVYEVVKEIGPEHEKKFYVEVFINKNKVGKGEGPSKKQAQQKAAKNALEQLEG